MNYKTMAKGALALSLSLIVGVASAADRQIYGATFESTGAEQGSVSNDYTYVDGHAISEYGTLDNGVPVSGWFAGSTDDESVVTNLGNVAQGNVLLLNTDSSTLTNLFSSTVAEDINDAIAADGAYFETEVKFVPSDDPKAGIDGGQDATKFAIFAYHDDSDEHNPTNLVVFHAYYDQNDALKYTNEVISSVSINCEEYTSVRVEMKQMAHPQSGDMVNVFSVKVGGSVVESDLAFDAYASTIGGEPQATGTWFLTVEDSEGNVDNTQVSSLNFKGTGEIDNIKAGVITTTPPPSTDWTIQGLNPRGEWTDPTVVADDGKSLFYSNLVVNVDEPGTERPIAAAWIGVSVVAPEAVTSENVGSWIFDVKGNGRTLATGVSFSAVQAEDGFVTNGCYVMNQWFGITPAAVRSAIAEQRSIIYTFDFYQENDSENKQTLTIDISPKNIQINANGVEGAEDLKVIDWAEQPKVSWTVENVAVTTNGAAAVQGFFAPNTVITFTPDTDMVITNIDGQAVANLATFDLTVTQATNITVLAGTVQQQVDNYAAGDTVDGAQISADMAAWLNGLKGQQSKTDFEASFDNDGLTLAQEYLLNTDPTVATTVEFKINSIVVGDTVDLAVTLTRTENNAAVTDAINGTLKILGAATVNGTYSADQTLDDDFDGETSATKSFTSQNKFFKAVIE